MGLKSQRVALVTGASRGAGKGIALGLATSGSTVFVSGRTEREDNSKAGLPGTIHETVREIERRGANGVALACDHADDNATKSLFERIMDQTGRLDILVNNACHIPDQLTAEGGFWEKPLALQEIMNVGMRSHYVASYYAAPIMVAQGEGLIVNTSSFGGRCYMHGPAYGAGKAATDKMACDMAIDLRPHGVAVISLWMGLIKTERTQKAIEAEPDKYRELIPTMENAEFSGRVIDALAKADDRMERSGTICIGAELALHYSVKDIDDRQPPSHAPMLGTPAQNNPAIIR